MIKKHEVYTLAALLAILTIFMIQWGIRGAVHSLKEITVPDITGKPLGDALEVLSKSSLAIRKDGAEFNDKLPPAPSCARARKRVRSSAKERSSASPSPRAAKRSIFPTSPVSRFARRKSLCARTS